MDSEQRAQLLALLFDPASHDCISPQIQHWLFRHGENGYFGTFNPIKDVLRDFAFALFPDDTLAWGDGAD